VTVLDASAVLALIHNEPGADRVADALAGAVLGTVNLAEVVGKLVDAKVDASQIRTLLTTAGVTIEPFLAEDAERCAPSTAVMPCRSGTGAASRWPCVAIPPRS
jgi:PIN domain nuclease of toxin-antitoxin system